LPVSFFQHLPALFHAGNAHGVFPPGLFPLVEPSSPLGLMTFVTLAFGKCLPSKLEKHRYRSASPSRLYSLRGFDTDRDGVNRLGRPLPSWYFGPLGNSPLRRPAEAVPLVSFAIAEVRQSLEPRRPLPFRVFTTARLASLSRECRPFWSFTPLPVTVDSDPRIAWLMVSPRCRRVVTNPRTQQFSDPRELTGALRF
jgi:hypothetical protein